MTTLILTTRTEIKDLEFIGWDFSDIHESVAAAQDISFEDAKDYNYNNYHVQIIIKDTPQTFYKFVANDNSTDSEEEATGDDEQTLQDLKTLQSEDKLFDTINFRTSKA